MLLEFIPVGHKNAVKISTLCALTSDRNRTVRGDIAKLREDNLILNLQDGKGYFRPSKDEKALVERYIKQEKARAKTIERNIAIAEKLLLTFDDE